MFVKRLMFSFALLVKSSLGLNDKSLRLDRVLETSVAPFVIPVTEEECLTCCAEAFESNSEDRERWGCQNAGCTTTETCDSIDFGQDADQLLGCRVGRDWLHLGITALFQADAELIFTRCLSGVLEATDQTLEWTAPPVIETDECRTCCQEVNSVLDTEGDILSNQRCRNSCTASATNDCFDQTTERARFGCFVGREFLVRGESAFNTSFSDISCSSQGLQVQPATQSQSGGLAKVALIGIVMGACSVFCVFLLLFVKRKKDGDGDEDGDLHQNTTFSHLQREYGTQQQQQTKSKPPSKVAISRKETESDAGSEHMKSPGVGVVTGFMNIFKKKDTLDDIVIDFGDKKKMRRPSGLRPSVRKEFTFNNFGEDDMFRRSESLSLNLSANVKKNERTLKRDEKMKAKEAKKKSAVKPPWAVGKLAVNPGTHNPQFSDPVQTTEAKGSPWAPFSAKFVPKISVKYSGAPEVEKKESKRDHSSPPAKTIEKKKSRKTARSPSPSPSEKKKTLRDKSPSPIEKKKTLRAQSPSPIEKKKSGRKPVAAGLKKTKSRKSQGNDPFVNFLKFEHREDIKKTRSKRKSNTSNKSANSQRSQKKNGTEKPKTFQALFNARTGGRDSDDIPEAEAAPKKIFRSKSKKHESLEDVGNGSKFSLFASKSDKKGKTKPRSTKRKHSLF